ncbi:MAG: leucine-rich repeat domain-containing protein [Turicibacter sp.]|nr:leucine-rich repeat domain-containing protein [Turicibacter sp.]
MKRLIPKAVLGLLLGLFLTIGSGVSVEATPAPFAPNEVGHNLGVWLFQNTNADWWTPGAWTAGPNTWSLLNPGTRWGITDVNFVMDNAIAAANAFHNRPDPGPPPLPLLGLEWADLWGLRWLSDVQRITITNNTPHAPIDFPDLSGLANLRELTLQGFNFVQTPTMATTIAQRLPVGLVRLNLANTNLSGNLDFTGAGAPALINLTHMDFSGNALTSLTLGNTTPALLELNVSWNNLSNLSISGSSVNTLQTINAQGNSLTSFPNVTGASGNFPTLTNLNLAQNNLATFTASGQGNLSNLDVSFNPTLSALSLSNMNGLTTVSAFNIEWAQGILSNTTFQNLPLLNTLDIQWNNLSTLDLRNLGGLQNLNASNNNLATVLLDGSTSLQNLNLAFNRLSNIVIPPSSGLNTLQLQQNLLTAFSVAGFPNLQNLSLSHNYISYTGRIPQVGGNWQALFNVGEPGTDTTNGVSPPPGFIFFPQWFGSVPPTPTPTPTPTPGVTPTPTPAPLTTLNVNGVLVPITVGANIISLIPDGAIIAAVAATGGPVIIDVQAYGTVTTVNIPLAMWAAITNRVVEVRFFSGTINLTQPAVQTIHAQHTGIANVSISIITPTLAALTPAQQAQIVVGSDFWRNVQVVAGAANIVTLPANHATITIPTPFNIAHTAHFLPAAGGITQLASSQGVGQITFNATTFGVFVVRPTTGVIPPVGGTANIIVNGVSVGLTRTGNQVAINLPQATVAEIARNAITSNVSFYLANQHGATHALMPTEALRQLANSGYVLEYVLPDGTLQFDTTAANSVAQQTNAANAAFRIENITQGDLTPAQAGATRPNSMVVRVQLLNGNIPIPNVHGYVTITVPFTGGGQNPGAWHIAPDGTRTALDTTSTANTVSFRANRFSVFEIGGNPSTSDTTYTNGLARTFEIGDDTDSTNSFIPLTFEIGEDETPPPPIITPQPTPTPTLPPQTDWNIQPAPQPTPTPVVVAPTPTPAVAARPNPQTEDDTSLPLSTMTVSLSAIAGTTLILSTFYLCRKKHLQKTNHKKIRNKI